MTLFKTGLICAAAAIAAASPAAILASADAGQSAEPQSAPQRPSRPARPSRQCIREIVELCGRNRGEIRGCLAEKKDEISAPCAKEIEARRQSRQSRREAGAAGRTFQRTLQPDRSVVYGPDIRQQVALYEPPGAVDPLPLVFYIHGGGWTAGDYRNVGAKPQHFTSADYYFASSGYRLLPNVPIDELISDLGEALQALRGQAAAAGFDRDAIILMGYEAGAHLAALLASDPSYAGDAFEAIQGVILIDGAGYDLPAAMADAPPEQWQSFFRAFGTEPAQLEAFSPASQIGGKDAPQWLGLYSQTRELVRGQTLAFIETLSAAGLDAETQEIEGDNPFMLDRNIGLARGAEQTQAIDAFLARVFAPDESEPASPDTSETDAD